MKIITFACGHDDRLKDWLIYHTPMIPGKIVNVWGGSVIPEWILVSKNLLVTSSGKYLGDGHQITNLSKLVTDEDYIVYASHDSLIIDEELISKSCEYMKEHGVDVLAPSLSSAKCGENNFENKMVLTSITCLVFFSARAFKYLSDNWKKKYEWRSEEVEFFETPYRAGMMVAQNPFIVPDYFQCRSVDEVRRKGAAIHPHKEWK